MLKVSKERNQVRNSSNYRTQESNYRDFDRYYNDYNYDTIDLNDEYDYSTRYDVDFAYDEYSAFDEKQKYVEPATEPRYSSFREYSKENGKIRSERKKRKMSNGMKALIVVYFAIVAIIASLLIVNALPMMNGGQAELSVEGMENVEATNVSANNVNNIVLADGTVVTSTAKANSYEYTINSNWFDNMCDWMENIAA